MRPVRVGTELGTRSILFVYKLGAGLQDRRMEKVKSSCTVLVDN